MKHEIKCLNKGAQVGRYRLRTAGVTIAVAGNHRTSGSFQKDR